MNSELISPVLRHVGALARTINTHSEVVFRQLQLQRGQFIYITRVCEHPGINLVDLANELCIDKTTVTKAVQKLIVGEWLEKVPDNDDRRMLRLYPTARSLAAYERLISAENCGIMACFSELAVKEQSEIERLLAKMNNGAAKLETILNKEFINRD